MSKNITAVILIVLAIGIYFTYTSGQIDQVKSIQAVNAQYEKAIDNASLLIKTRDQLIATENNISPDDLARLNKILPDNVDNVRLIIDVKDNIAASHGLFLSDIKTSSPDDDMTTTNTSASGSTAPAVASASAGTGIPTGYGSVTLSFSVTTSYQTFIDFMKDLEASLRIMDISKLDVTANDSGTYDFDVEIKTYWLKQ